MRTANCPQCRKEIDYVPEQEGTTGYCLQCGAEVPLKIGAKGAALSVLGLVFGGIGLIFMVILGILGGLAALLQHGVFIIILAGIALLFGMKLRDVFIIFALYFGAMIVISNLDRIIPDRKPGRRASADPVTVSPPVA